MTDQTTTDVIIRQPGEPVSNAAPILMFLFCIAVAVALGFLVGSTRYSDDSLFPSSTASMLEQPLEGTDKAFNWLLFTIFAGVGVLASSVLSVGVRVAQAVRDEATATRQLMKL